MQKYLNLFSKYIRPEKVLTDQELEEKAHCEESFYNFVAQSWRHIEGKNFIQGWHINAICEHLEALYNLQIRNLVINIPPRFGKSIISSVCYPAYLWIKEPSLRFLYSSYAQSLSAKDSVACRRLIQSEWYQNLWGDKYSLMQDVNHKLRFDNDKNGYRISSSVGGSNTGLGGDFVICDDPNNVKSVESEVTRNNINDWWDFTMTTRFGDFKTGRRLIIQQRTHMFDLTGHVLNKNSDNWVLLRLPMEFEKSNRCTTIPLKSSGNKSVWMDPRLKDKELLWPQAIGIKELTEMKNEFRNDSYVISGQLQQRPAPADGGIFRREWFKTWKEKDLPKFEFVLSSVDTALTTSETSCYSAITTWGVFEDDKGIKNIMLLSLMREKLEYPDLRKMAVRISKNYNDVDLDHPFYGNNPPDLMLIEAKVNGYSLLQDMMAANLPVMSFNPNRHGDKIGRARIISHLVENGLVWLQTSGPKHQQIDEEGQMLLSAAEFFPRGDGLDLIDSMTQAFIYIKNGGWVYNIDDPQLQQTEPWQQNLPYY